MDRPLFDIYLVNGNITIFFGTHADGFKNDILNSSLLGELVSASKHSHNREMLWSDYVETVSKIGWITKSREFKRCEFSGKSLLKIVEQATATTLNKEEKQTLSNAFLQLKKPPTQSPVIKTVLDKLRTNIFVASDEINAFTSTKPSVATTARLTFVRDTATIITLQVAFKTSDDLNMDILDQPILNAIMDGKSNTWLLASSLDSRRYDNVREAVIKKVGSHLNTDLLHVPTPNRAG
ncbi:hypothetical protein DKY63_22485 [Pseudomonas putida]|uniref:Uncharacterized protein n=1 Tax=Pseudomonas putida TaxID=303 RepID=A0A2Z4RPH2_PSEPU|nr:hypothetical protein [Pseudomonas putida]AWY42525.1 hypothetical protein DKY63_22485 [Pseudomonas putida]